MQPLKMAYNFFGDQYDQPWPSHWSRQNNFANAPFSFNNRKYYSDYFNNNRRSKPLIHHHRSNNYFTVPPPPPPLRPQSTTNHWSRQNNLANAPFSFNNRKYYSDYFNNNRRSEPLIHHHRRNNYFTVPPPPPPPPPQSTTNMLTEQYIATFGRNGSKAKFRFHGGIGDGRGGLACRMPSPRLIKLFDELNPIDMLIKAPSVGFLENHVARAPTLPLEASNETGVFLPVYPKKIHFKKGMRGGNGGCSNEIRDVTKAKECAEEEAIPVELMLSGHAGHVM